MRVKGVINFAVSILAFVVYDSFAHRYLNKRGIFSAFPSSTRYFLLVHTCACVRVSAATNIGPIHQNERQGPKKKKRKEAKGKKRKLI